MRRLAAQEGAQWEDEEQSGLENQSEPPEQLTELGRQMKELDARQARIETHLIKLMPSAKKAEEQFATIILAGKELRDEMAEHRRDIATSLTQYTEQVTATAGEIKGEFKQQLQILQSFFDGVLKLSEKNEQMVDRCQDMVATSSAIYHKGSAGVSEMSEKTQGHLKDAAEAYRKRIEAQAEHFESVFGRLSKLLVVGTFLILLTAFIAGASTGAMWLTLKVDQAVKTSW
jgi:chromosome segregation ATPase